MSETSIQFSALRKSIKRLQKASQILDIEKTEAEEHFKRLLNKLPGRKAHELEEADGPIDWLVRLIKHLIGLGGRIVPIKEFIKAAKRVQRVNEKLAAFEQGFISEGGIKDREWYKHLGVAPGKWLGMSICPHICIILLTMRLGYGATTLPALSEAIEFEKNETLAAYEEKRLITLLDILSEAILP